MSVCLEATTAEPEDGFINCGDTAEFATTRQHIPVLVTIGQ
jgi:hypothetical protein